MNSVPSAPPCLSSCLTVPPSQRSACFNCLAWARTANVDGNFCTKCSNLQYPAGVDITNAVGQQIDVNAQCFACTVNLDDLCFSQVRHLPQEVLLALWMKCRYGNFQQPITQNGCYTPPSNCTDGTPFYPGQGEIAQCWDCMASLCNVSLPLPTKAINGLSLCKFRPSTRRTNGARGAAERPCW